MQVRCMCVCTPCEIFLVFSTLFTGAAACMWVQCWISACDTAVLVRLTVCWGPMACPALCCPADMWRAQAEDRSGSGEDGVADEAESDSALVEPLPALSGRAMRHRG
jgi:hypothetical protein